MVYVRNSIGSLSEVYGGQNIYDALLGNAPVNNNQESNNAGVGIGGGRPPVNIRGNMAVSISRGDGLMSSMHTIIEQLQRRLSNRHGNEARLGNRPYEQLPLLQAPAVNPVIVPPAENAEMNGELEN